MEGLGFAIPISDACAIANDIIQRGYVPGKAYLGLTLDSFSPAVARYFHTEPGAFVSAVQPGSAAVDGRTITDADALVAAVRTYEAGDTAMLTVVRDGESLELPVTFGEG